MSNNIQFFKYHGTGNDFILIDQMEQEFDLTTEEIALLCHRRFGIGADGLMMLRRKEGFDFEMVYFNSDGNRSTMCGNGGRCIVKFAFDLGYVGKKCLFSAVDGPHTAEVVGETIELHMIDVKEILALDSPQTYELFTGSPHYIRYVKDVDQLGDIVNVGKSIRYSDHYHESGINVNLVYETGPSSLYMATYERGVEDETFSCGTGVTAAAISMAYKNELQEEIFVKTKGGDLSVSFEHRGEVFEQVILKGPAVFVFKGEIKI